MPCEIQPAELAAYLDNELAADRVAAVRQHIAGCPRCGAEVAELVQLKRAMRPAQGHFTPSAEFRRKMRQEFAPKRRWWLSWPVVGGIAVFAVALVCAVLLFVPRGNDALSEVADLHVNALASTNPYDVVSSDRHMVKPWFQGRIPFTFNVPELAGTEYTLLGARMVYLHQQPGAELIVGLRQHKISVFIFEQSSEIPPRFGFLGTKQQSHAFNVESWHSSQLRFYVIGDADAGGIDKLAATFRQVND